MPISSAQLEWRYAGGSNEKIVNASLHAVFPEITGAQNRDLFTDQVLVSLVNTHPTLTLTAPKLWVPTIATGGVVFEVALDPVGVQPADADHPLTDGSPPAEGWAAPATEATGLEIADIPPIHAVGVWLRRTATNSAELVGETNVVRVSGTTAP